MGGLLAYRVLAATLVLLMVILTSLFNPLYGVYGFSYLEVDGSFSGSSCCGFNLSSDLRLLNFVNVTSVKPVRFDVTPLNVRLLDLLSAMSSNISCSTPGNLKVDISASVILNETKGRFGTVFVGFTVTYYNETYSSTNKAYILGHKANLTHGIASVILVLVPNDTGEVYRVANLIADYKPLEDKPTKLADIIYLNTTQLNTEMKLSEALRTIAVVVDRVANNYESTKNETLKLQAKAYKAIASQTRIIASLFENKLREYNLAVETITAITIDQEEELWISKCTLCLMACRTICSIGVHIVCGKVPAFCGWLALICGLLCHMFGFILCYVGCRWACKELNFCP